MCLTSEVHAQIASSLKLDVVEVGTDLAYQSIARWDSLSHFTLMIDLENAFGVTITNEDTVRLTSVKAIVNFVEQQSGKSSAANKEKNLTFPSEVQVRRGLVGVHFDTTSISQIDQNESKIYYRGFNLPFLAKNYSFESTSFLLLYGALPNQMELALWRQTLASRRELIPNQIELIKTLKDHHPADALRTIISSSPLARRAKHGELKKTYHDEALRWIALVPTIVATHHRLRTSREYLKPNPDLDHASNFLYMLNGEIPDETTARLFDRDLTIHAEHGANASTFASRVSISAQSDFVSALTAAMSTFSGRVHGGAIEEVLDMLNSIRSEHEVKSFIQYRMESGLGVPGFGHRIYRTEDPRAALLLDIVKELSSRRETDPVWPLIEELKNQMEVFRKKGLEINVDFYSGLLYRLLGIQDDLAISMFFMARVVGISSHIIEQANNNILIRPLLKYRGPIHETP